MSRNGVLLFALVSATLLLVVLFKAQPASDGKFTSHNSYGLPSKRYSFVEEESTTLDEIQAQPRNFILSQKVIKGVKKFVFFIGYPRSGNSIVGALLDAHPHILLSHELHFFRNWQSLFNSEAGLDRRTQLYNKIYKNSGGALLPGKARKRTDKGYTLAIESSWQGKFDDYVEVIGDKGGGAVSHEYLRNVTEFVSHYKELQEMVAVPIKVIHMVRNPFDMITTNTMYEMGKRVMGEGGAAVFVQRMKENRANTMRLRDSYEPLLRLKISDFFNMSYAVGKFVALAGRDNVLDVQLKDLVDHPRKTMLSIMDFLEVSADDRYLKVCEDKVFRKLSHSRNLLRWPDDLIEKVQDRINKYAHLSTYNFTSD